MKTYKEILPALLGYLGWKGEARSVKEALPPHGIVDLQDLRNVMAHLGYESIERKRDRKRTFAAPGVGLDRKGNPRLLTTKKHFDLVDKFITFRETQTYSATDPSQVALPRQLRRFKPLLGQIMALSLVIGGLTLAPIAFNRSIYDHVIASGNLTGMSMLVTGVLLALSAEIFLRHLRNRRQSFFGARIDQYVSCSVLERLLFLPPLFTERASVSSQLARLRDFEAVREFFTGPLAGLFFEIPLIILYLVAMAIFAGWLTLVPVCLLGIYAVLITSMAGRLKDLSRASSTAATQRQEFLLETVTKLRAIRQAGMEDIWQERFRTLSGRASQSSFKLSFTAQSLETISYVLMMLSGIATLGLGVVAVITQSITTGALVAAMMLIWRIIAPLQICCASLSRLQQLGSSVRQIQRLLAVTPEHNPYAPAKMALQLKGRVTFHRVSLRYSAETDPALLGVSFDVQPGQIVAIRGNNGSGKSTILKLILALYQPQGGGVRIDGFDIRQFDPVLLRQSISYIPQNLDLFPGTILDNLRMPDPTATRKQIEQALKDACAYDEVMALPQSLDTYVSGESAGLVPFILRQRLNLARAYLKTTPIMLFDEASYSLGSDNDIAFTNKINSLRGKATVFMVTHREDHMRLADQLFIMNKGELTHGGPPDQVLNLLQGRKL